MSGTHQWDVNVATVGCTNPSGAEGQIDPCGVGYGGQPDITHKYECVSGKWLDRDYNPVCVAPACEDYTTQEECEKAGCFWYAYPNPFGEPSCHEKDMITAYLPLIIMGVGGALIIAALASRPKPAYIPIYYPPPPGK